MRLDMLDKLTEQQRGDFQTPESLARKIWATLDATRFDLVIEPTFGLGSFLTTMPAGCTAEVLGWEIHQEYQQTTITRTTTIASERKLRLLYGDVMEASSSDIGAPLNASLLVIGNPPWVTNAEQSVLGGKNTGPKRNLKAFAGLDALTGKANFDLSEAIILHLVNVVQDYASVQFALLVKFTVLRNLLLFVGHLPRIGDFEFHRIDSQYYFGAAVDAGLLKFRIGDNLTTHQMCTIFDDVGGSCISTVGLEGKRLIYDLGAYKRTSFMEQKGVPHYTWRQGVKHDLRDVFELIESAEGLWNRRGEPVNVESEVLFPLYKSSDLFHGRKSRFVIPVYQRDLQDNLATIEHQWPQLWHYLNLHADDFRARRSSIYKKRPLFSVFGIGEYTYYRYKVAISGFYTEPVFRLLEPDPYPAVTDDTCYLLATDDLREAVYLLAVLSLDCTREFLLAISYNGDKRRFSKEVLSRVLIPPYNECPAEIRAKLVEQWQSDRQFSPSTTKLLHNWLVSYSMPIYQPPLL